MINTQMVLSFLEKDSPHIPSNYYGESEDKKTVYEVAVELEEKYHIVSTFVEKHKDDISFIIAKEKFYILEHPEEADKFDLTVANAVKGLWTNYIDNREHQKITGFQSKRSKKTGTATFYDTGEYSDFMLIKCNDTVSQGDF